MLSFNTENVPISNPFNIPNNQMYMAGHPEVNQNPFITVMQALFLNNHNRIAENVFILLYKFFVIYCDNNFFLYIIL